MKNSEENQQTLIPAEPNEVERFPAGSKIRGTIGGISEHGSIAFVCDPEEKTDALFVNSCGGDFHCGDQGFAVMSIDEKTKIEHWRFEYGT